MSTAAINYRAVKSLRPATRIRGGNDIPEAADVVALRIRRLWSAHRGLVWVFVSVVGDCYVVGELHTARSRMLDDKDLQLVGVYCYEWELSRVLAAQLTGDLAACVLDA